MSSSRSRSTSRGAAGTPARAVEAAPEERRACAPAAGRRERELERPVDERAPRGVDATARSGSFSMLAKRNASGHEVNDLDPAGRQAGRHLEHGTIVRRGCHAVEASRRRTEPSAAHECGDSCGMGERPEVVQVVDQQEPAVRQLVGDRSATPRAAARPPSAEITIDGDLHRRQRIPGRAGCARARTSWPRAPDRT